MGSSLRVRAGFTLVEVLVAMFVVALGIAGAAALQALAVRSTRDAAHLSDGSRLARSLAERMRANPHALALPDKDNPYLQLDYDAGSGAPTASSVCYAEPAWVPPPSSSRKGPAPCSLACYLITDTVHGATVSGFSSRLFDHQTLA